MINKAFFYENALLCKRGLHKTQDSPASVSQNSWLQAYAYYTLIKPHKFYILSNTYTLINKKN